MRIRHCLAKLAIGLAIVIPITGHADLLHTADEDFARLFEHGKYSKALPHAEAQLRIAQSNGNESLGAAQNNLGEVLYNLGRYAEARQLYEHALQQVEASKGADHLDVSVILNNLGGMMRELGEFDKATLLIERALAIAESTRGPDHPDIATSLNNLGLLHKQMGRSEQALKLLERSLSIREKTLGSEAFDTARSLNNLASVYVQLKRYAQALPLYERALEITVKRMGAQHVAVAIRLNNLASVKFHLGDFEGAQSLYEQAATITTSSLGPIHVNNATNLNNLAGVLEAANRFEQSRVLYERALLVSLAAAVPENSFNILANLARFHDTQGDADKAVFFGKLAINTFQSIRFNALNMDRNVRRSLIAKNQQIYHELANWLIDAGRIGEARHVLKMLKEEEYFDFIRRDDTADSRLTRINFIDAEETWHHQFVAFAGEAKTLGNKHTHLDKPEEEEASENESPFGKVWADLENLEARFLSFLHELPTGANRVLEREHIVPNKRKDILVMGRSASTAPEVALLEYVVAGDRIRILLTIGKETTVHERHVDGKDFYRKLVAFRQSLESPRDDPRSLARELHNLLIEPVATNLRSARTKTLLLSLEGALRYIPFSALHDGDSYLAEQYSLVMHTAAVSEAASGNSAIEWEIAAFGTTKARAGFTALPGVERELAAIVGKTGLSGEVYLDDQFTSAQIRTSLDKGLPVLHVASHFKFAPGTEADSYLLLGDGRFLTLRELREGDYPLAKLDLLALSACETAMHGGREANGREVEGMAVLARSKGAKAVLATLWPIADESTPELMKKFYITRKNGSTSTAEALRHAQIALINGDTKAIENQMSTGLTSRGVRREIRSDGRIPFAANPSAPYAHPYFWAPFVLIGAAY